MFCHLKPEQTLVSIVSSVFLSQSDSSVVSGNFYLPKRYAELLDLDNYEDDFKELGSL